MKTIKRNSFESEITYRNKKYIYDSETTMRRGINEHCFIFEDRICVEVVNNRLKGKTDLYGKPYQNSKFYYKPI